MLAAKLASKNVTKVVLLYLNKALLQHGGYKEFRTAGYYRHRCAKFRDLVAFKCGRLSDRKRLGRRSARNRRRPARAVFSLLQGALLRFVQPAMTTMEPVMQQRETEQPQEAARRREAEPLSFRQETKYHRKSSHRDSSPSTRWRS